MPVPFSIIFTLKFLKIGALELREITAEITNEWGANERKYGLFRVGLSQKVLDQSLKSKFYREK